MNKPVCYDTGEQYSAMWGHFSSGRQLHQLNQRVTIILNWRFVKWPILMRVGPHYAVYDQLYQKLLDLHIVNHSIAIIELMRSVKISPIHSHVGSIIT